MCVCIHLQQQNERMCVGIGRHIKKAVHQQNTDEVTHRLPVRMTLECVLTFTRYARLNHTLKEVNTPVNETREMRTVRASQIQSNTQTSEPSGGYTTPASAWRNSDDAHSGSLGRMLWSRQRNCITLAGSCNSHDAPVPDMRFVGGTDC